MSFWHEIAKQAHNARAVVEVKQIGRDLENYVEAMRKNGLTNTFGLVRAMVVAVLKHGGCEPAEMVASLRKLADEVESKKLKKR